MNHIYFKKRMQIHTNLNKTIVLFNSRECGVCDDLWVLIVLEMHSKNRDISSGRFLHAGSSWV